MAVESVSSGYGSVMGAQAASGDDLGKIDFMNLLIAQMKHQDPLSPMDNQQFISQLTQFTSLEELSQINERLEENMLMTQGLNNTLMVSLVGKEVTVQGDGVRVNGGEASRSRIQTNAAGQATVEVRGPAGQVVATYTRSVQAGLTDLTWDGRLANGEVAPDGNYSLEIAVTNAGGDSVAFVPFMSGPVDSLRFENNLAIVEVAGNDYYVAEILEIINS